MQSYAISAGREAIFRNRFGRHLTGLGLVALITLIATTLQRAAGSRRSVC